MHDSGEKEVIREREKKICFVDNSIALWRLVEEETSTQIIRNSSREICET